MGWPVTISNSKQFTVDGEKYAVGMVFNDGDDTYWLGVFHLEAGQWIQKISVERYVTNDIIMAAGSVSAYMTGKFPAITTAIREMLTPIKPDQSDKGACVGYDFSQDVNIAPDFTLTLNKQPPLSHAR